MQALAEVEEDKWLDDGQIEIPSDEEYNGWYCYVPKFLDIYLVYYRKNVTLYSFKALNIFP